MTEVNRTTTAWATSQELQEILYELIKERTGACIVVFKDPGYSAENGGYHPVEIMIGAAGDIQYITDYSYYGQGEYAELIKEIDFDFSNNAFQHVGMEYQLKSGHGLYKIWEKNFCTYHRMGVYQTKIEEA